jgi:hypothetical protein
MSVRVETDSLRTGPLQTELRDGETRTRTGDTTIFSRVLYQLSYLARRSMLPARGLVGTHPRRATGR